MLHQTLAVFSETTYSWEDHGASTHWSLLDLATGEVSLLFNGSTIAEIVWVGPKDTSVFYVNGSNSEVEGGVEIWVSDATDISGGYAIRDPSKPRPSLTDDTVTKQHQFQPPLAA